VPSVPSSVQLSAYRIVQESLTNTLKHAGASHSGVSVDISAGELTIEISDDGAGLDPARPPGRGLRGMHERASLHAGTLQVADADVGVAVNATLRWDLTT
jgi:signal transduction histidine kinase